MSWDVNQAVAHLQNHKKTLPPHKPFQCAKYTREAIEAGGVTVPRPTKIRPEVGAPAAADYGLGLLAVGFVECRTVGPYQKGDIVIFQPVHGHPAGHIAMYDGARWISDYPQSSIFAARAYEKEPKYRVYRHRSLISTCLHTDVVAPPDATATPRFIPCVGFYPACQIAASKVR